MDELSDSQFCDERPRLHAGSGGGDIGSCQPHSIRGSLVKTTPGMGVKAGGAIAWRSSEELFGEYGIHLRFIKSICGIFQMHRDAPKDTHKDMHMFQVLISRVLEISLY